MYGLGFPLLSRLHPFHFAVDGDMFVVQAGAAIRKLVPDIVGRKFGRHFELRRPRIEADFNALHDARNAVYLIACLTMPVSLKGQMLFDEHKGIAFFFGSPIVESGAVIRDLRLTLSEFPIVDSSIDGFVLRQQTFINKELESLVLERTRALDAERKRTERLLHAILPPHIVPRLKEGRAVVAEQFDQVTVLFLDLVGFTELTTRHPGAMIVTILNEVFRKFDGLLEGTDVEKIKTIGDAYMCVGGLSGRAPRQAAERVALVALQMRDIMAEPVEGVRLEARIGLHSGPAIAGVIGTSKFAYDLWGDTVNTAARMESHGAPGRIHCSQAAYDLLRGSFDFEDRGCLDIRGKGPMRTWFLTGEKDAEPGGPRPGARPGGIAG